MTRDSPSGGQHQGDGQRRRYVVFDALRCVAAAAVLVGHAFNLFTTNDGPRVHGWLRLPVIFGSFGGQAVIAFFVLSGFWISKSIAERHAQGRWSWSDYAIDRLSRLWLVLIPGLMLGGILDVLSLQLARFPYAALGSTILGGDFAQRLTPEAFFGDMVFLQKLLVPMFGSNTALWSLANEFWYYLWFPAIVGIVTRRVALAPSLAAAASMIAFPSLLPGFLCWLTGVGLYAASRRWRAPGWAAWPAMAMGAGVLATIRWWTSGAELAVACVVAVVLWCCADADVRTLRPLAAFGRHASYSLYVCHIPLLVLAAGLLLPGHRLHLSASAVLEVAGVCAIVLGCAWGFSRLTEAHTGVVRRRIRAASQRMAPRVRAAWPRPTPQSPRERPG